MHFQVQVVLVLEVPQSIVLRLVHLQRVMDELFTELIVQGQCRHLQRRQVRCNADLYLLPQAALETDAFLMESVVGQAQDLHEHGIGGQRGWPVDVSWLAGDQRQAGAGQFRVEVAQKAVAVFSDVFSARSADQFVRTINVGTVETEVAHPLPLIKHDVKEGG